MNIFSARLHTLSILLPHLNNQKLETQYEDFLNFA